MTVPGEDRNRVFDGTADGVAMRHVPVEWPRPRRPLRRRLAGLFEAVTVVAAAVVGLYAIAAGAVPVIPAGLPQMAALMVALLPACELAARVARWIHGRREDWDELEPLV